MYNVSDKRYEGLNHHVELVGPQLRCRTLTSPSTSPVGTHLGLPRPRPTTSVGVPRGTQNTTTERQQQN